MFIKKLFHETIIFCELRDLKIDNLSALNQFVAFFICYDQNSLIKQMTKRKIQGKTILIIRMI